VPGRSLENVCGRAALLARKVEGNAGARLSLGLHRGMAYHPGEDQRCSMKRQITVPHLRDHRRIRGATLRQVRNAGLGRRGPNRPHRPHATMRAVPSAASRQVHIRVGRKGQHRRNQRKAEDGKQNDAEHASHTAIVASFVSHVSEICSGPLTSLRNLRPICSLCRCFSGCHSAAQRRNRLLPLPLPVLPLHNKIVISTEAARGLIVSSAAEKSASLPPGPAACVARFVSISAVAFALRAWLQGLLKTRHRSFGGSAG
jgi:hypothetical protein